jgi:hypothetical protein
MDILATVHSNFLWNHYKMCNWQLNLILQMHFWCDTWQGVHYYLTSEDYICHRLLATIITYRFCLLVRIKSEKCHWKLYSCFHASALCDIYTGMVTGMLQCYNSVYSYYLGSWMMGNFPSYFMHQEYFLIKWSLQCKGSCHWEDSCCLMAELSVICGQSCVGNDTQCVYQGQLNLNFKNLFGMITEWSPIFSPKHSNNTCSIR